MLRHRQFERRSLMGSQLRGNLEPMKRANGTTGSTITRNTKVPPDRSRWIVCFDAHRPDTADASHRDSEESVVGAWRFRKPGQYFCTVKHVVAALDSKSFCSARIRLGSTNHGIWLAVSSQPAMNEHVAPVHMKGYARAMGNGKHGIYASSRNSFAQQYPRSDKDRAERCQQ